MTSSLASSYAPNNYTLTARLLCSANNYTQVKMGMQLWSRLRLIWFWVDGNDAANMIHHMYGRSHPRNLFPTKQTFRVSCFPSKGFHVFPVKWEIPSWLALTWLDLTYCNVIATVYAYYCNGSQFTSIVIIVPLGHDQAWSRESYQASYNNVTMLVNCDPLQ